MDKRLLGLLEEAIKSEIRDLSVLNPGSPERETAVRDLVALYKLRTEEVKNQLDYDEKRDRRLMEDKHFDDEMQLKREQLKVEEAKNELDFGERRERRFMEINQSDDEIDVKKDQLAEQIRDRYFRIGIEAAGIVLPLIFYAVWMKKGLRFEETGTFTSTTFRGLLNRFKPTKK